jgi:hypothetical protein
VETLTPEGSEGLMMLYDGWIVRYGVKGAVREAERCFNSKDEAEGFAAQYLANGESRWAEVEKVQF